MKTIKNNILVVVFMFATLMNFANNANDFRNTIEVAFNNIKKGNILTIKNNIGTIIFSEKITDNNTLDAIFDFKTLTNGNYTIELEKAFEIISMPLIVKSENIIFRKDVKNVTFKPVIRNKENVLMISKIAFDNTPLKIDIYFNNEYIFSDTVKDKNASLLNRVYKLDKNEDGNYKVIVRNNSRSYTYTFNY